MKTEKLFLRVHFYPLLSVMIFLPGLIGGYSSQLMHGWTNDLVRARD